MNTWIVLGFFFSLSLSRAFPTPFSSHLSNFSSVYFSGILLFRSKVFFLLSFSLFIGLCSTLGTQNTTQDRQIHQHHAAQFERCHLPHNILCVFVASCRRRSHSFLLYSLFPLFLYLKPYNHPYFYIVFVWDCILRCDRPFFGHWPNNPRKKIFCKQSSFPLSPRLFFPFFHLFSNLFFFPSLSPFFASLFQCIEKRKHCCPVRHIIVC